MSKFVKGLVVTASLLVLSSCIVVASSTRTEEFVRLQSASVSVHASSPPSTTASPYISISFDPKKNGFKFSNWADLGSYDNVSINVLRRFYGDRSVCQSIVDGVCTPYQSALEFANQLDNALSVGRCEGVVAAAYDRYQRNISNTPTVELVDAVDEINYWSLTQLYPAAQSATATSKSMTIAKILDEVFLDLKNGGGGIVGLYSDERSHSLLPIALYVDGKQGLMSVYDPNSPLLTQTIEFDLAAETWLYRVVDKNGEVIDEWSGANIGSLSFVPFDSRDFAITKDFSTH